MELRWPTAGSLARPSKTSVLLLLRQNWLIQHYTIPLQDWYLGAQPANEPTILAKTQESTCLSSSTPSYCRLVGQASFYFVSGNFGLLNISGMRSCCQHKVESFSYSAIVDLLRAVWNSLQRLLCCCSWSQNWLIQHYTIPLQDWYLRAQPKIQQFWPKCRESMWGLVIFNSSYCRLARPQYFFTLFQQLWASERVWKTATSLRAQHHAGKSSTRWNHSVLILVEVLTYWGQSRPHCRL